MADISTLPTNVIPTTDPNNDTSTQQDAAIETQNTAPLDDDFEFEELDEELIIEDFTIDGICGVY